jgi:phosphatidyl-myo-inositol dimannoside synthase
VNVLLLTPELFASEGGIARILRLYLKALCAITEINGKVRLISLNDRSVRPADIGPYANGNLDEQVYCGRSKLRFILATLRMGLRSDVIVCGHVAQLPVAWAASKLRPGLSYYLVAHGIEVWRPFRPIEKLALRGARCVWCVSDYTRRRLLENCPLPADRITVLPNALDPYFEVLPPPDPPTGPPVILTISRLSAADNYKGIHHLIEAMPSVRAAIPDALLRIVGRGDALPGLQALATRLEVASAVQFGGFVPDPELRDEFARCRLFALPSKREGFGLVYLEAMAHGRPCLGANSGGAPEVICGDAGMLVEYGDVPGISTAIVNSLSREWKTEPIRECVRKFSYSIFRDKIASLLAV